MQPTPVGGQMTGQALTNVNALPTYSPPVGTLPNSNSATNVQSNTTLIPPKSTQPLNFLNELTNNTQSDLNTATNEFNKAQATQDGGITDFQKLSDMLVGQTADKVGAETSAGLPGLNSSLRDLQTLSQRQLASYAQAIQNNDVNATGMTRTAQNGNEAFATRQHGIDAMITNANISAVSGQIATANAQVDRAMSLKYDPIKQMIQNKLDFLNLNKDNLNRADKKLADAKAVKLNLDMKKVEQQQANEKESQGLITEAASLQAPLSVVQQAQQIAKAGGSPADVAKVLGKYSTTFWNNQKQKADIALTEANTSKAYAEARKAKTEADVAANGGLGGGATIENYTTTTSTGKKYVDTSNITDKKDKVAVEHAAIAKGIPVLDKDQADQIDNIEVARKNLDNIQSQIKGFASNSAFSRVFDFTGQGKTALGNKISRGLQTKEDVAAFSSYRSAAIELMRAMAGSKGLRITKSEIEQAMNNDIPTTSDTFGVGLKKIANVKEQLASWEDVLTKGDINDPNITKDAVTTTGTLDSGMTYTVLPDK